MSPQHVLQMSNHFKVFTASNTLCVCERDIDIEGIYTSVFLAHLASWEMSVMTLDRLGEGAT